MTEHALIVIERIADSLIRQVVTIDESQFGFDAFEAQQMQTLLSASCRRNIFNTVGKRIYMAFVDLEKAFNRVPRLDLTN